LLACMQVKPLSNLQLDEQPSPSLTWPTSHSSLITKPTPQADLQPAPLIVQSGSV
jgi:hypothetical protein